jgi:hypothetical protein
MVQLHLRGRVTHGHRRALVAFLADAIAFYEAPGGMRIRALWAVTAPEMRAHLHRWRSLRAVPPKIET